MSTPYRLVADEARLSQKGVMISHRNVIANVLQVYTFEKPNRDSRQEPGSKYDVTEVAMGLLPQSHIYALVVICHASTYRGDQVINLPKFEMGTFLNSIQRFKINQLFLVRPPSQCFSLVDLIAFLYKRTVPNVLLEFK